MNWYQYLSRYAQVGVGAGAGFGTFITNKKTCPRCGNKMNAKDAQYCDVCRDKIK